MRRQSANKRGCGTTARDDMREICPVMDGSSGNKGEIRLLFLFLSVQHVRLYGEKRQGEKETEEITTTLLAAIPNNPTGPLFSLLTGRCIV